MGLTITKMLIQPATVAALVFGVWRPSLGGPGGGKFYILGFYVYIVYMNNIYKLYLLLILYIILYIYIVYLGEVAIVYTKMTITWL